MVGKTAGFVLASLFACVSMAEDGAANRGTGKPLAIEVNDLLKQAAAAPLGPGEAGLLKAIAELVEKEALPSAQATPGRQRRRLAFRLRNVPAIDAAQAVEKFFQGPQHNGSVQETAPSADRVIAVAERVSNTLLVSAAPATIHALQDLVANLDARPDMVMIQVVMAHVVRPPGDTGAANQDSAAGQEPSMGEQGAAWLAWASKHGRLEVLSRPQVMTLVNQPAIIQVGSRVPPDAFPASEANVQPRSTGLKVALTPNISRDGRILIDLDAETSRLVKPEHARHPVIARTGVQTTISAKDGETVILGGITQSGEQGDRQLIIAVTPRVNPTR